MTAVITARFLQDYAVLLDPYGAVIVHVPSHCVFIT